MKDRTSDEAIATLIMSVDICMCVRIPMSSQARFRSAFVAMSDESGARAIGRGFWRGGDLAIIDGILVNGSARLTGWFSGVVSLLQSGMIYRYASVMLMGVAILAFWFLKN